MGKEVKSTAVEMQQEEIDNFEVNAATDSSRYKQVSYDDAKLFIRTNLESAARSFIAIGYYLKLIRDGELYREEGHESIWDFAQAEYGISKSTASRYMSMNDRFALDGNSPIVDQKYKDFGKSKLQEMLYLTDEQLEQVTPEMKVQEIRSMRQPKEIPYFEIEGQLDLEKDFPEVIPGTMEESVVMPEASMATQPVTIQTTMTLDEMLGRDLPEELQEQTDALASVATSQRESPMDNYEFLEKQCNALARRLIQAWKPWFLQDFQHRVMNAVESEKQIKKKIKGSSRTWYFKGDTGKIMHANLFEGYVQFWEKDCLGNCEWFYLCAAIQGMWNAVAMEDIQEGKETLNAVSCAADTTQNAAEAQQSGKCLHNPMHLCNLADEDKTTPGTGEDCMHSCYWNCTKHGDCRIECYASERRKYQAENEDREETLLEPIEFDRDTLEKMIRYAKGTLVAMKEEWIKNQPYTYAKYTMMVQAYEMLLQAHDATDRKPETEVVEQPELPLLKNNDQRAAFIDNYATWPLWIDTQATGEKYYRYDLLDGTSFVVRVYRYMQPEYKEGVGLEYTESYGDNEYYIMEEGKFFRNCRSNRSAMIEKLKELQKGGKS